jgi:hypothetical protein
MNLPKYVSAASELSLVGSVAMAMAAMLPPNSYAGKKTMAVVTAQTRGAYSVARAER